MHESHSIAWSVETNDDGSSWALFIRTPEPHRVSRWMRERRDVIDYLMRLCLDFAEKDAAQLEAPPS